MFKCYVIHLQVCQSLTSKTLIYVFSDYHGDVKDAIILNRSVLLVKGHFVDTQKDKCGDTVDRCSY